MTREPFLAEADMEGFLSLSNVLLFPPGSSGVPGALVPEGSLTPGVFVADGDAEGSAEASGFLVADGT